MQLELLDVKTVMSEYGLSRRKVTQLMSLCDCVPRMPRGKRYVTRREFERVLGGEK